MREDLELEITKDFSFEAAHYFEHEQKDHPFRRLHGHSFSGSLTLKGDMQDKTGWVHNFWDLEKHIKEVVDRLDHHLLNEVEGLEQPSLENIALWVFEHISKRLPKLERVEIRRPSCGERACVQRKHS